MIISIVLLVLGFVLLIKGADYLVDGAVTLANRFRIPPIVIGLTIISFGTSLPELVVNSLGSYQGESAIVYGNVIGSNIMNILLILGITGIIQPLRLKKNTVWKEIPFSLIAVLVLFITTRDGSSNFTDGIILLLFFLSFMLYVIFVAGTEDLESEAEEVKNLTTIKIIIYILGGLIGLVLGGRFIVNSAVAIATLLGISEKMISLTIVSIGTSLPELTASVVAARRGFGDLAIGNVVGSNIFNIFLVVGVSSLINPLNYNFSFDFDLLVLGYATVILILTAFVFKKMTINKKEATLMFLSYLAYMFFTIYKG